MINRLADAGKAVVVISSYLPEVMALSDRIAVMFEGQIAQLDAGSWHGPAFAGETTLAQCFAAILACRTLTARVLPAPALVTPGRARRELSQAAHAQIATRLGFPPAHSAPERARGPQAG